MTERISQTILCLALFLVASGASAEETLCDGPAKPFDIPNIEGDVASVLVLPESGDSWNCQSACQSWPVGEVTDLSAYESRIRTDGSYDYVLPIGRVSSSPPAGTETRESRRINNFARFVDGGSQIQVAELVIFDHVDRTSQCFAPLLHDPDATPSRDFAFADIFSPWREPSRAIRNASHKLVDIEGTEELYNLVDDPYEYNNLLADELSVEVSAQRRQRLPGRDA